MAENPTSRLEFGEVPKRVIEGLPTPLPVVGDDFDWLLRDYDGFRMFILEELAARIPERKRWTSADLEVVLIEVFSAALDQLSDMADRVAAEQFLETARRPSTVRKLLQFIGYDAVTEALANKQITASGKGGALELEKLWSSTPHLMEDARITGPRDIHKTYRMVSLDDYVSAMEEHPLVLRAGATTRWRTVLEIQIAVLTEVELSKPIPATHHETIVTFHQKHQLPPITGTTTLQEALEWYADAYRMIGQPLHITQAKTTKVNLSLSVVVNENFFQAEIRSTIEQALGNDPGGFFERGSRKFGQGIRLGDLYQALMNVEGIDAVTVQDLRKKGSSQSEALAGLLSMGRFEVAELGDLTIQMNGGRRG